MRETGGGPGGDGDPDDGREGGSDPRPDSDARDDPDRGAGARSDPDPGGEARDDPDPRSDARDHPDPRSDARDAPDPVADEPVEPAPHDEPNGDPSDRTGGDLGTRLWHLLKLSRPRFWLYLAGPVVVGVAYGAGSIAEVFSPSALALFAYFLVPANVYLYGVNDVFDADLDRENPKKDDREVRYRGGRAVPLAVAVSGVGIVALVPVLSGLAMGWLALYVLLATEYSAPPLRFKTTPFLDSLSNGLYVLPGVAAYATLAGENPPALALAGGWLWTMAMHTFSAIPDVEPDRAAGIRTTATVLGEGRTYAYCALAWTLAALAFAAIDPRLGMPLAVYPLLVAGIALSDVDVERAYWYYPAINAVVGALLTVGGIWVTVHGDPGLLPALASGDPGVLPVMPDA